MARWHSSTINTICLPRNVANLLGLYSCRSVTALFNFWRVVTITTFVLVSDISAFESSLVLPVPTINVLLLVLTPVE